MQELINGPELIMQMGNIILHFKHDGNSKAVIQVKLDASHPPAMSTTAPLDDSAIVQLMAFANSALVRRLDTTLQQLDHLSNSNPDEDAHVLPFKPREV